MWREPALSYAPPADRTLELRGGPDGVIRSNLTINEIIAQLERKSRERDWR